MRTWITVACLALVACEPSEAARETARLDRAIAEVHIIDARHRLDSLDALAEAMLYGPGMSEDSILAVLRAITAPGHPMAVLRDSLSRSIEDNERRLRRAREVLH